MTESNADHPQTDPAASWSHRPLAKLRRQVKWQGSKLIYRFKPILPDKMAASMERRIYKYGPLPFSQQQGAAVISWDHGAAAGPVGAKRADYFRQLFAAAQNAGEDYVPHCEQGLAKPPRIKAIAFYLPQFHPIPENDAWWGRGFTEWTNVSKAVPQFVGHYQPHLPGELGFYDLRVVDVQRRQIELAKHYGLHGFCFHYYWFTGGKRLLERPLNQFLEHRDLDFPFCICWANENWTRRWDGGEDDILMEQRYERQDDLRFIRELAPILRDPRYIRVNGRPLIIVYRVDLFPTPHAMVETWREYCMAEGLGNPLFVAAQFSGLSDPRPFGFDAAVEFPPHNIARGTLNEFLDIVNPDFQGKVYDYMQTLESCRHFTWPDYTLFKAVMPSWDNEARRPGNGHAFWGSTPAVYREWLAHVCQITDERYTNLDEKLVFINAWNEWGEGAHLEPDRRFGYGYLEATKSVLSDFALRAGDRRAMRGTVILNGGRKADTAVILHLFYEDLWPSIKASLDHLGPDFDLYVSIPDIAGGPCAETVLRDYPHAHVVPLPNRGRDTGPFFEIFRHIATAGYRYVCKIHTKKSLHRQDGHLWRDDLLVKLLGSPERVAQIKRCFDANADLGMIGPEGHYIDYRTFLGSNETRIIPILRRFGIDGREANFRFFAGSMFWFRPEAMEALAGQVQQMDFEPEFGQVDGTLGHVWERLFAVVCETMGYRVITTELVDQDDFGDDRMAEVLGNGKDDYTFADRTPVGEQERLL